MTYYHKPTVPDSPIDNLKGLFQLISLQTTFPVFKYEIIRGDELPHRISGKKKKVSVTNSRSCWHILSFILKSQKLMTGV